MADPALPDWYTPETPEAVAQPQAQAAPQAAPAAPLPDWYAPETTESVTVEGQAPETLGGDVRDVAANVGTGVARIPGAILGTPHVLAHTLDWFLAHAVNTATAPFGGGTNLTGADLDKYDPAAIITPKPETIDKGVFKGISAVAGHDVQPYEPKSFIGKLVQAGITGAGAGLLDPMALASVLKAGAPVAEALTGAGGRMAKTALAADAASATQQAFPDSPGLAALAAVATHTGAGAASRAAQAGYDATLPLTRPTLAGTRVAGKALAGVDNTQPGMATPSPTDLSDAVANTRAATDDIGTGMDSYDAGAAIRDGLQGRKDALTTARGKAADTAYAQFRAEAPLEGAKLAPFMQSPAFRAAVKEASDGSLNRMQAPLTEFLDFNAAGDPVLRPNAAVPPDVLQRIKGALDDTIASPATGNVRRGDLTDLRTKFVGMLDKEYPNTYPQTRADFAAASRPLDPLETGPVAKVLDSDTRFGRRTYTMPQDKIAGTFLKAGDGTRSAFNSLIAGFGGDKDAAMGSLEQNLANKVAGAVNGDGTLSLDAFNKAVRPYTTALNMWFPQLSQKFSTAEAAQKTLETLRSQDALAQSIRQGDLKDGGNITQGSAQSWITKNEKALNASQAPGAVMRLKQIAAALPTAPTAAAEAVVEGAPAAVGFGLGGAESGIFGAMFHAIPKALAGPSFAKFNKAYSAAIERAFSDPAYAARLSKGISIRPKGMTPMQALGNAVAEDLKKGVLATPAATIAGGATR